MSRTEPLAARSRRPGPPPDHAVRPRTANDGVRALVEQVRGLVPYAIKGRVSRLQGLMIAAADLPAPVGAECEIDREGRPPLRAEVVGFQGRETRLLGLGEPVGVRHGCAVRVTQWAAATFAGEALLGRVVNAAGEFLDAGPRSYLAHRITLQPQRPSPLERPRIDEPLITGVRAIDGLLTIGKGQRLGIFSGSGVGKSTLLGQLARASTADVNVVVLVGERSREVREFLERDLGQQGLQKSVVVVATSDEPAVLRVRAALLGSAYAEYFRDRGRDVLLMMDSVTRCAFAQREIGLAAGEPPATRGYPPSVFALLPKLLERSGRAPHGSITGLYTVLVEGDDTNEPISDAVRGILDGHVVLSRRLAEEAHFPAIDVLGSISRLANELMPAEQQRAAQSLRQLLAAHRQAEDLISIGAYQAGSSPAVDAALQLLPWIRRFLQQGPDEYSTLEATQSALRAIAEQRQATAPREGGSAP